MADGYARASGRIGCVITISGPGVTNVATALAEAQGDSSRVLHICSSLDSAFAGREVGALHELVDQSGVLKSVAKWHRSVRRVSDIPEVIAEAIHYMNSGRPGPTSVEIPLDILADRGDIIFLTVDEPGPLAPDAQAVDRAARTLSAAAQPVILAGGGVVAGDASGELIRLAEKLGAPVLTTVSGKGAVALVLGSQLSARHTDNWTLPMPRTIIHVDIHSGALGRHYPTVRGIHAHVRPTLEALVELIDERPVADFEVTRRRIADARKSARASADKQHLAIFGAIRDVLPPDGMLFNDMTTICYSGPAFFPVSKPRTFFFPNYVGTLGFSFPAALGAKLAQPDKTVISLVGDGGFMFTSQELSTAVQEEVCLPIVVFNDQAYSQLETFFTRSHGRSDPFRLTGPDLKTYARAFGVPSSRVSSPRGLRTALTKALDRSGPTVIDYALGST
jgi:acetolactate synthase-1/2/3 large subunit